MIEQISHYFLRPQGECMNIHGNMFAIDGIDIAMVIMFLTKELLFQLTKLCCI